jgi:hypothetical protein
MVDDHGIFGASASIDVIDAFCVMGVIQKM